MEVTIFHFVVRSERSGRGAPGMCFIVLLEEKVSIWDFLII